jgi:hypothetical protein
MSNELNNILPNDEQKQKGLHALSEDLFSDEEDIFEQDAQEGLQEIPTSKVASIVDTLNADLHKKLQKNKKRKRAGIPSQQTTYITIITILLLAVIAYIVIKKFIG